MAKALPAPDDTEDAEFTLTGEAEDVSGIVEDIDAQLNNVMSELGADKLDVKFIIKVYRVVPNSGVLSWVFDCSPAELPILARLRDDYNGGKFECRVYKNNRIFRRVTVHVDAPNKPKEEPKQSEMAQILKAIADQQAAQFTQLKETLLQIAGKQPAPQQGPLEMMTVMLDIMKSMKEFTAPINPVVPSLDPEKTIDLIMRGMELGRESGGGGDDGIMGILKEFVKSPLLGETVKAMSAAQSAPQLAAPANLPVQIPAQLPQTPISATPNSVPTQPQVKPMQNQFIANYVNQLVDRAKRDSDPMLYAHFILDNVPEQIVRENIAREDLIDEFSKYNPLVREHVEWFTELRNNIIALLTEDEEAGDDVGNAPEPLSTVIPTVHPERGGGDAGNS